MTKAIARPEADAWRPMDTAPEDGAVILGRYDEGEIEVRWSNDRRCMLAYGNPGAGAFGAGWENVSDDLPMDEPQCWQPVPPVEHLCSDACPCEPVIVDPATRWHRGDPAATVFVPSDGDDIDAAGYATTDHR